MSSLDSKEKKWRLFDKVDASSVPTKIVKFKNKQLSDNEYHKRFFTPYDREKYNVIDFDTVISFIDNCKVISLIREIQIKARIKRQELEVNK